MLGAILQIPGVPGGPEVLIILVIIVFLFGANKIPELAGALGEARGEFEQGRSEVEGELEDMQDVAQGNTDPTAETNAANEATAENDGVDHNPPEVNEKNTDVESN
jgi:sec-independent protein translocase protein TatA